MRVVPQDVVTRKPTGRARPPPGTAAHQRRRPVLPASQRLPLPPLLASGRGDAGPAGGGQPEYQDLLREAERLRDEQRRMESEAERLAADLEGLPAFQQLAVLEALGLQRQREEEALQQAGQQQAGQQQVAAAGETTEGGGGGGEESGGEDPPWMDALSPQLREQIRASGLADALREQAAAVAAEQERELSPEFGGARAAAPR